MTVSASNQWRALLWERLCTVAAQNHVHAADADMFMMKECLHGNAPMHEVLQACMRLNTGWHEDCAEVLWTHGGADLYDTLRACPDKRRARVNDFFIIPLLLQDNVASLRTLQEHLKHPWSAADFEHAISLTYWRRPNALAYVFSQLAKEPHDIINQTMKKIIVHHWWSPPALMILSPANPRCLDVLFEALDTTSQSLHPHQLPAPCVRDARHWMFCMPLSKTYTYGSTLTRSTQSLSTQLIQTMCRRMMDEWSVWLTPFERNRCMSKWIDVLTDQSSEGLKMFGVLWEHRHFAPHRKAVLDALIEQRRRPAADLAQTIDKLLHSIPTDQVLLLQANGRWPTALRAHANHPVLLKATLHQSTQSDADKRPTAPPRKM